MKSALEAEMMVGTWYVPDETDIALGGIGLIGKAAKAAKLIDKVLDAAGPSINKALDVWRERRRAKGLHERVAFRVTVEDVGAGRAGTKREHIVYPDGDDAGDAKKLFRVGTTEIFNK